LSLPASSPAPPLDDARAEALARSLHRAAVAWAHTFLHSRAGLDAALLEQLTTETLAFGLMLLEDRWCWRGPDAETFTARVRRAAWTWHAQWRKDAWPARQLTPGDPPAVGREEDASEFTLAGRNSGRGSSDAFQFTEAMHAEFCELTGLGTKELVGGGANLAAMIFYLVVHGRVFARRPHSREERRWLVQALRECREQLTHALDCWLLPPTVEPRPVSARIGR